MKITIELRNKLMSMKYKLGAEDLEDVIQRMLNIIIKMKLAGELEKK